MSPPIQPVQDPQGPAFKYEGLWNELVQRLHDPSKPRVSKAEIDLAVQHNTNGEAKSFHDLAQMRMTNASLAQHQAQNPAVSPPGLVESSLGAAANAATLNFLPRIEGPLVPGGRKAVEERLAAGRRENPWSGLAAIPGGMLPAFALPGVTEPQIGPALLKGTAGGAVLGGASAAGAQPDLSNPDLAQIGKGAGLGSLAGFGGTAIARGLQASRNPAAMNLARGEENIPLGTQTMAGGPVPGALSADVPRKLPIVNEEVMQQARSAARVPVAGRVMANNLQTELKRVTGVINSINEGYQDIADQVIVDPKAAQILRDQGVSTTQNPVKPTFANLNRLRQDLRDQGHNLLRAGEKGNVVGKKSDAARMIQVSDEINDMLQSDPNVGKAYTDLQSRSAPWQQYRSELADAGRAIGVRVEWGRAIVRGRRLFLQNPRFSVEEGFKELTGATRYQINRRMATTVAATATGRAVNAEEYNTLLRQMRTFPSNAGRAITGGALAGAQAAVPNLMGEPEGPNDK
jgi:hypothetical protein